MNLPHSFTVRAYNCLVNAGIKNLKDLALKTEDDLLLTKNLGKKTLNEIKGALRHYDLSLGMSLEQISMVLFRRFNEAKEGDAS